MPRTPYWQTWNLPSYSLYSRLSWPKVLLNKIVLFIKQFFNILVVRQFVNFGNRVTNYRSQRGNFSMDQKGLCTPAHKEGPNRAGYQRFWCWYCQTGREVSIPHSTAIIYNTKKPFFTKNVCYMSKHFFSKHFFSAEHSKHFFCKFVRWGSWQER